MQLLFSLSAAYALIYSGTCTALTFLRGIAQSNYAQVDLFLRPMTAWLMDWIFLVARWIGNVLFPLLDVDEQHRWVLNIALVWMFLFLLGLVEFWLVTLGVQSVRRLIRRARGLRSGSQRLPPSGHL